ncbi:MAG: hypothetical protein IT438_05930 [Phycisphaerales bacterium]|nr:hypothetical protein [Phycisphaerales bacterium]
MFPAPFRPTSPLSPSTTVSRPTNERAITYLSAGNGITGTITAAGDPLLANPSADGFGGDAFFASIGKIVVGPSTDPVPLGIQGDIHAKFGKIGSIFTTGPIGSATNVVEIVAGDGISEVRAVTETFTTEADADFNIDLLANSLWLDPNTGLPTNTFAHFRPETDGLLTLIETAGDLNGEVRASNLGCDESGGGIGVVVPGQPNGCMLPGIFVRGIVRAPITIDYHVWFANIVARTFLDTVTIGRYIKGAVVAVGGAIPPTPPDPDFVDGHIATINIGLGDLPPLDTQGFYARSGPGLCGISAPPFTPVTLDEWFDQAQGRDAGAIDGLVKAAASIGTADLASISLRFQGGCKEFAPRLESPVIGWLHIEDLRVGVVWSGLSEVPNNPANDFALIGQIEVGCVGPEASVWMTDWTNAGFGNVFGDVHVPAIAADQTIRIAGHLGDHNDALFGSNEPLNSALCECLLWTADCTYNDCFDRTFESSPRDPQYPECAALYATPRGRIWVRSNVIEGQVIINAGNNPHSPSSDFMTGGVQVGVSSTDPDCPSIIIADDSTGLDIAPYYDRLSTGPSTLGGGAVGVAPFHAHEEDGDPPHDEYGTGNGISEFGINATQQARLTFYGPIAKKNANQSWTAHVRFQMRPFPMGNPAINACAWMDITNAFDVFGPTATTTGINRRSLLIAKKPGIHIAPGIYRMYPVAFDSIKCENVTGKPPVVWPTACVLDDTGEEPVYVEAASYVFVVSGDCDNDDILDQFDPERSDCDEACSIADFDYTDNVTVGDIFYFLNQFFAQCGSVGNPAPACGRSADVNDSGAITVQDLFDFLAAYFVGCP